MDNLPGGPLLAERLDKAVREVCPIHGISIGRRVDEDGGWARNTWRVNPKQEATLDEIQAAYDVLAAFDPDAVEPPPAEPAPEHRFPASLDERLVDYGDPAAEADLTTDDLLDFDAEPELPLEMTGDELLNAFEKDEGAAAVLIQTLSALRQKHISEQLNVERARLDREHQATGVANPRSAQIDRLLGLLTRRGEV